jgi:carboxymethylenebutenolidase
VFDIKVYPGAPHAFFNDTRESYRPEAAKDAWKRTLDFFKRYLKA